MGHALHDLVRHNVWATAQVLDYCRTLDPATLDATRPGVYGTIIQTLHHTIGAEASYLFRLTGAWPSSPWQDDEPAGLAILAERAAELARVWEGFLAGEVDPERLGAARGDRGEVFAVPVGIFITQAMHHGSEHRAQICTILGALGHESPDVSAWGYAWATGRTTMTSPAVDG